MGLLLSSAALLVQAWEGAAKANGPWEADGDTWLLACVAGSPCPGHPPSTHLPLSTALPQFTHKASSATGGGSQRPCSTDEETGALTAQRVFPTVAESRHGTASQGPRLPIPSPHISYLLGPWACGAGVSSRLFQSEGIDEQSGNDLSKVSQPVPSTAGPGASRT